MKAAFPKIVKWHPGPSGSCHCLNVTNRGNTIEIFHVVNGLNSEINLQKLIFWSIVDVIYQCKYILKSEAGRRVIPGDSILASAASLVNTALLILL